MALGREDVNAATGASSNWRAVLLTSLVLWTAGLTLNLPFCLPLNESLNLGKDLFCDSSPLSESALRAVQESLNFSPSSLGNILTSVVAVLFPVSPALLLGRSESGHLLLSQLLGQSASFGISEVCRRMIFSPDETFWARCNISREECHLMAEKEIRLFSPDPSLPFSEEENVLCRTPINSSISEIYESLHSLPDMPSALTGASLVAFSVNLARLRQSYQWTMRPPPDCLPMLLLLTAAVFVLLYLSYALGWARLSFPNLLLSIICGIFIQVLVSLLFRGNKNVSDKEESLSPAVSFKLRENMPVE